MPESALLAVVDRDFRSNTMAPEAPPTRFQLNLTERCNLRCEHCITLAPARTADGSARSMDSRVLDALQPHLRHAHYVGLTHAGEPTIAPAFEPLLLALKEARGGAPTVVHVVTNGQTLKEANFRRWTELGVSSWSVSLDGLGQSHDRLRLGSHAAELLERLAQLVALRDREGWAVRLGVAWTVTAENLGELQALPERLASVGVDWVKLEEVAPINPRAQGLATIEARALAEGVEAARRRAWTLGLPLLDHVRPVETWKCRGDEDPEMDERGILDDFVNRIELNPCRLPYELVHVEPNGDVRAQSFHHPVVGNLVEQDLLEIWRGPGFASARGARIRERLCGVGPVRCAVDPGPAAELRPIHFVHHAPPGRSVEVLGDFPTWKQLHPMRETAPGVYERTLAAPPGVHRYKFRIDRRDWQSPEEGPHDEAEGLGNGLRVVGGEAEDALTFAPDPAHVTWRDGALRLHAEATDDETYEWCSGPRRGPLRVVTRRGARRFLVGEVNLGPDGRYGLARAGAEPRRWYTAPSPVEGERPPPWATQAVYYAVFVDRWHRGRSSPPDPRAGPRSALSTGQTYYGGDLYGLAEWVPNLAELGVDALLLTPIHTAHSPHRYDGVDLTMIDPRLGGEAGLITLLEAARAHGLRVVLDAAFTHVHQHHPAFRSVLAEQRRSPFASWFRIRRWPVIAGDLSTYEAYADLRHLPRLEVQSPAVEAHLLSAAQRLVELGVDGFRLDAMDEAPSSFWRRFRSRLLAQRSDLVFLGEVIHDRPALHLGHGADQATDFPRQAIFLEAFARGQLDAAELWRQLELRAHRAGPQGPEVMLGFLDNHDTARFRSVAVEHDRLRLALAFLLAQPGPAALYYGTECGLAGGGHDGGRDHVWCERLPMPGPEALATRTRAQLTQLLELRRRPQVRAARSLELERAEGPLLVLRRGPLRLAYNLGRAPVPVPSAPGDRILFDTHGHHDPTAPLGELGARWLDTHVHDKGVRASWTP